MAQRVLYSPYLRENPESRYEVAGKTGNYYWLLKQQPQKANRNRASRKSPEDTGWLTDWQGFDVFDTRMNLIRSIPMTPMPEAAFKEYFVPGTVHFDRLILTGEPHKTLIWIKRWESRMSFEGSIEGESYSPGADRLIGSLPFKESANSFLLVRSADRSKTLLLAFEPVTEAPPKMHAIIFDQDWMQLSYNVYEQPSISQPMIQDDAIGYPAEEYGSSPVKIANNGQWLMAAPSRTDHNFLLFHFCGFDNSFSGKVIRLPSASTTEDIDLSIDNEQGEAIAGVLSRFRYTFLKNVQVVHYSLLNERFDFDSSYRFSTRAEGKAIKENLEKERFLAVPGSGFLLLKEYGRPFTYGTGENNDGDPWDPEFLLANNLGDIGVRGLPINLDGYTREQGLAGFRSEFDRGDLSLFYFPGKRSDGSRDSCWSGMINKEQTTEMNAPWLSYLAVPLGSKIFLLYNSFFRNQDQYGTTAILDHEGHLLPDEGLVFSRYRNTLRFQESRQISEDEVAIPYEKDQRKGFSIIRF